MSEFIRSHSGAIARVVAPLAALTMLSCSAEPSAHRPEPWEVTVPEITPKPAPEPVDECAVNNDTIAPFRTDDIISADDNEIQSRSYNEDLTEEEATKYIEDIRSEYGVNLTFPDKPSDDSIYDFGTINDGEKSLTHGRYSAILSTVKALRLYSPDVIKALQLTELVYVKGITRKPDYKGGGGLAEPGGMYDPRANKIFIDVSEFVESGLDTDTSGAVTHELAHAIDERLLCGPNNSGNDSAITDFNTHIYKGYQDQPDKLPGKFIHPSKSREFARQYGASSVYEDRATIIEWTFTERGLIQEGDPDWDSPLAHKQQEMIRRFEQLTPGVTDFLRFKTEALRNTPNSFEGSELTSSVETSYFPGEFMSFVDTLERANKENVPVEMLSNGALEFTLHDGIKKIVVSPIIMRNPDGNIVGFIWTDGFQLESEFYDPTKINLRYNGDNLETIKDKMVIELGDYSFFNLKSITVQGRSTDDYYIENDDELAARTEAEYPNIYDPSKQENTTKDHGKLNIPTIPTTTLR